MDKVNNFSGHESHVPESLILRTVFWIPGDPARASPSDFFQDAARFLCFMLEFPILYSLKINCRCLFCYGVTEQTTSDNMYVFCC